MLQYSVVIRGENEKKLILRVKLGPLVGAFDGKVETSTAKISAAEGFSGPKITFPKGYLGRYLSSECGHPAGSTSPPEFFNRKIFSTMGLLRRGNPDNVHPIFTPYGSDWTGVASF